MPLAVRGDFEPLEVQIRFQIFDYPGLAIPWFIAVAAGGFWLVISIFVQDYKSSKKFIK